MVQILPVNTTDPNAPTVTSGPQLATPTSSTATSGPQQNASVSVVAPPTDTRTLISQNPQPGYIQGYDTQNNYNPVYVPQGKYVAGISATPKQMTTASFNQETPINLTNQNGDVANPNAPTPNADVTNAGAAATVDQITKQLTPAETPLDQKQQSFLDSMASLTQELGNKGADQLAAEQSQGIPQLKQQFSDINGQILTKLAESKALDASYQAANTQAEGSSYNLSRLSGQEAQNYKMYLAQKNNNAAEIGLLQATAQGLQGQIQTAQDTANRAIDLKYSTIQSQLDTYKAQLDAIQPSLNKQEKEQALAQQTYLQQQQQKIADQKQTQKDIQDLKFKAIEAGLTDSKVLAQFDKAKTVADAQSLAAPYVSQAGLLDIQLKKSEIAKNYASTAQNTPEAPPVDPNSQSILAQTGISSTVFNYITQGTSALARLPSAQRLQIQKQADEFLNKNGLDYSTFKSRYAAYNDVLQKNLERANNTAIFAGEVAGTVDQFINDFNFSDVKNGFYGLGSNKLSAQNVLDVIAGKQVNNPLATKYSYNIQTMANDLAGYMAASRGATQPENVDLADAAKIVAEGINTGSAQALKDSINANETKVTNVVNKAVEDANRKVWDLFGVGANYKPPEQLNIEKTGGKLGELSPLQTVQSNGQTWNVGQTYQDKSGANWQVDAQGNWKKL